MEVGTVQRLYRVVMNFTIETLLSHSYPNISGSIIGCLGLPQRHLDESPGAFLFLWLVRVWKC